MSESAEQQRERFLRQKREHPQGSWTPVDYYKEGRINGLVLGIAWMMIPVVFFFSLWWNS